MYHSTWIIQDLCPGYLFRTILAFLKVNPLFIMLTWMAFATEGVAEYFGGDIR